MADNFKVLNPAATLGAFGTGGMSIESLNFLREDVELSASEALGEAGNGVVLRGGWRRFICTSAAFIALVGLFETGCESTGEA